MNAASIAIGDLAGAQTVTRTVTNVGSSAATYTPSVTGMTGFTRRQPVVADARPGRRRLVHRHVHADQRRRSTRTGGQLTWTDGTHNVRIPLVVRPVALAAPAEVSGTGRPHQV